MKKKWHLTKLERRVQGIARRRATQQLMRVPWGRFRKAYEDYLRWEAFALWARAIVETEGSAPSWLVATLKRCCPGFVEEAARSNKPEPLGLQLLQWVHNQAFRFAKEEGWLDALVFYGFRDARSQGNWAYWEHCESEWKKRRPASFPTFAEWRRSALDWKLHGDVGCTAVAKAVEKYIAFEAFVYWLRPLFQAPSVQLPAHIAMELEQECPGLLEFVKAHISVLHGGKSRNWQRLFDWGKDHVLSRARKEGWLDCALRQARFHPRHVRIADYASLCCRFRFANPTSPHASFEQWRRDAQSYVKPGRK